MAAELELLEDRTLLASALGAGWEQLAPLGSLMYQQDFEGNLVQTVDVFSDDFESGSLGPEWSTSSSTANGRIAVSSVLGTPAHSGSSHLAMDTTLIGSSNLNEAILTLDLSGLGDVDLSFWHKDINDEDLALPATFAGSVNGDGVSISEDGATWHRLTSLNNANSPNNVYTEFTFDLDQAATDAGISLDADFHVKFQQFDNFPFNTDGRTFDDVLVQSSTAAPDSTTVFLEGGQTLTVVATPDDSATTLTVDLFDPADSLLASATASGAGETVDLQTVGIAADGDYRIDVSGDTASDFDLSLFRNATVEVVDTEDGAEQDASGSFISLGSGRWGIVGEFEGQGQPDGDEEARPIVWAIQPESGDILKIDPETGTIVDSFAAPDALSGAHRVNGLTIAEEGNTLLYVNGGTDGTNLYRLDPGDGTVLSVEFLPTDGTPAFRGGLSFESGSTDSIFAIDDGAPVDRQAGFGGSISDWTPSGAGFPGALGGDDHDRLFLFRSNQIQEFSTTVANTQLNAFAVPSGAAGVTGLAFDGVNLYLSDAQGSLFTLDPDTGAVLNDVTVVGGFLSGLGADIVGGGGTLQSGPIFTTHADGTRLGTIDRATGNGTDVGPFGSSQTWAAAFDTDGTLFTLINGFSGNAVLATVDQSTGTITTIGSGVGTNMISLEVAPDGTMYGIGYNDRILYEIDKTTGSATAIGNTGISLNMDLAFDSAGVMYATVGNRIWTVDRATGNSTLLGTYSGIVSGSVMGIMFDHTDTLYATAYVPDSPLYEIDTTTLSATVVGNTTFFRPHGGDIYITSSGPGPAAVQAITPAATSDIYGDPGEPDRLPTGGSAVAQQPLQGTELLVNGSFETGDFTGWTTVTTGNPFRPWAVTGAGQGGGFGMLQTQPQDGTFVAWNGFDGAGPMEFQMFQDVSIAAGSTATLSWMDRVQWNFNLGGFASLPRLYDVEIRDPSTNAVLQTVFSFSTGTQSTNPTGNTGWQSHSVDVSAFAGQTVRLFFRERIPQSATGPGQIEFDAVSLVVDQAGVSEDLYAGVGRGSPVNPGAVLLVDQNTGAGTLVGDPITPGGLTGLDFDSSGRLWGSSIDGPLGNRVSDLVEIDPDTGALLSSVAIVDGGTPISIGDLAVQPGTDTIFGVHSNSDATSIPGGVIYTIDPTTGAATFVGNTGQGRGGGLAFAPDGTFYFLEFNELHELNPNNAAILNTTSLDFGGHDGLGIRPSDGVFFASRAGAGSLGDEIRIIDPAAGTSTPIGQTGAGNASDLAFRVTGEAVGPDVDEYLLDLTSRAGRQIDVVLSTGGGENVVGTFKDTETQTGNVFSPNVLNFDFTNAPSPIGDANLVLTTVNVDVDFSSEFLTLDAEGLLSIDVFDDSGPLSGRSETVVIPQAVLEQLAADGTISFRVTPSPFVDNLIGNHSLTLDLTYDFLEEPSAGDAELELLDTDGTTVLATGAAGAVNYGLGILDFVVPADGVYTVRVTGQSGRYGIAVTDDLVFDTEPNEPGGDHFNASLTQGDVFIPNVLTFDFHDATTPISDGVLDVTAFADLNATSEFLTLDAEGLFSEQLFVTDGLQEQTVSTTVTIPQPILAQLAADGTISFTVTPSSAVNNLEPPESSLTLELSYQTASALRSLDPVSGALGFLGEDGDGVGIDLSLLQSFESMSFPADSAFIPPDPIIAAGPQSVVTMVNTDIAIHDKGTGAIVAQSDLDGAGGFWATSNVVFDPWIVYDPHSDRFVAMGVDRLTSNGGSSRIYLAVSTDATPTNLTTDWNKYIIDRTGTHVNTGGATFPDYPKLGVNQDAIFVTANDFGILGGGFSHVSLFAIEKAPLLSGGPANIVYDEVVTGAFSIHPVVNHDSDSTMYFAEAGFGGGSSIRLHAVSDVLTAPVRTTSIVGVDTYNFPPDVPQQGAPPLDSVDARIMSGVVRDGSLWTAHAIRDPAVDTETVVRWYEFDVGSFPGGSASLVQSGNVDPGPGVHTWMPHINVDNDGDMGIGFSISGPNRFAGIGYTGRLASDAPGTTRDVEIARNGEASYALFDGIGRNRWGDYSGLAIDPDGETFWLYNEYAADGPIVNGNWGTFVGAFQIEPGTGFLDQDAYSVTLTAGDTVGFRTATPFDSPADGLNLLDPALEVLDPDGNTVAFDSNSADGKNAEVAVTPPVSGVYTVVVSAEAGGGAGEYLLTTFNVNDAPVIESATLDNAVINENDSVTLTVEFSDPDPGDSHIIDVSWGDGGTSMLAVAGPGTYSFTHQYLDDGPSPGNGTPFDVYDVSVTVTDAAGDSDTLSGESNQEFITNGGFETGDFTGWTISTTSSANWVINDGTLDPPGPGTPLAPISGSFDAVSIQSSPSVALLSESFVVPESVTSAVLSWSDRIRNHAGDYLDPGQEWRVLVVDDSGNLIQEVFSTNPGDPLQQIGPNDRSFDLTSLMQSLGGQTIAVSFEQQSQLFFMNATLDDVSLQVTTGLSVTVNNVAPEITGLSLDSPVIDESETVTLSGSFEDPGTLDVHTVEIDWGDGTVESFVLPTGDRSFAVSHQYLDDGPSPGNGTASDVYDVSVSVSDDDGGIDTSGTIQQEVLVNGSFETGSFSGWTTVTTGPPFRPWQVTGAGLGDGFGLAPTSPQDGAFVAWNGFDGLGPMQFQMYQDVTISAGSTATLSWMDRVQWNFTLGGQATLPRLYDVQVRDPATDAVLETLFSFSTGTQAENPTGDTDWQTHSADLSDFAGQTVRIFFAETIPQAATGPGQIEFDAISLSEVDSLSVTVNNVAPEVTSFADPAPASAKGNEGEPVTLSLDFTDPGSLDVHTVEILWGDGNSDTVELPLGDRSLTLDHTYAAGGIYEIDVTVSDDDTGSDSFTTFAFITGVGIQNVDGENVLYIVGTAVDDDVTVNQQGNGLIRVHASFIDEPDGRTFDQANADRIVAFLCEGDDHISIASNIVLPSLIDAGAGNDHVIGGGGSDVLLGRDGDDHLNGGSGRDILIGGFGTDRLVGGQDEDILFGGVFAATTIGAAPAPSFIADQSTLEQIRDEWLRTDRDAEERKTELESLDAFFSSLFDDGEAADELTGSAADDWFLLFGGDRATDLNTRRGDLFSELT